MNDTIPHSENSNFWTTEPIDRLGPILNAIGIAVFVIAVDEDGGFSVEFINTHYERTYGISNADLAGRRIDDILSAAAAQKVEANYERCVRSGAREQYDEEISLPSGTFFARTVLTPLTSEGRTVRLIGTTMDLTDRRALELELAIARDRADAANAAKSSFMANMSHELRTPLNAVIGFSEMIEGEFLGPIGNTKYREYAGDILFAGRHLLDVVNDILDLARVESGTVDMQEETFDVHAVIADAIRLAEGRAEIREATVENVSPGEGILLFADQRMIRQALVNLIANARKFAPDGSAVRVGCELLDDGRLAFVITDSGRGISAADLPTALAPFGRVEDAMNASVQGAGLGLPITKALTERHGGELFINSQPGVGTTVFMVLPAARVSGSDGRRLQPSIAGLKSFFTVDGVDIPASAVTMAEDAIDELPIGAVQLDANGTVLRYNAAEASFAEMRAERVRGRNFFREVAPCTFTDSFHGRFRDVAEGRSESELFSYVFTLRRPWKVLIEMRRGAADGTVWLFIRWV